MSHGIPKVSGEFISTFMPDEERSGTGHAQESTMVPSTSEVSSQSVVSTRPDVDADPAEDETTAVPPPKEIHLTYNYIPMATQKKAINLGYVETYEFEDENGNAAFGFDATQGQRSVTWQHTCPFIILFDNSDSTACNACFSLTSYGTAYLYWSATPNDWGAVLSTGPIGGPYTVVLVPRSHPGTKLHYSIVSLPGPAGEKKWRVTSLAIVRATIKV